MLSSSRASYGKQHCFDLHCTGLGCHGACQISSKTTIFGTFKECTTFIDQLKCLHSIVYLQRHVGWHAWHLLEGVLHSIIHIHNQQYLDLTERCCLQLTIPILYVSCRSSQDMYEINHNAAWLAGGRMIDCDCAFVHARQAQTS